MSNHLPLPRLVVATQIGHHAEAEVICITREPHVVDDTVTELCHNDRRILVRPDSLRELYDPTTHEIIERTTPQPGDVAGSLPDASLSYRLDMAIRVVELVDLVGQIDKVDDATIPDQVRREARRIVTPSSTVSGNPFDARIALVNRTWSHDDLTKALNRGAKLAHADVTWSPAVARPVTTTSAVLTVRQEMFVRIAALGDIAADLAEASPDEQPWFIDLADQIRAVADPDRPMEAGRFASPTILDSALRLIGKATDRECAAILDSALGYADFLAHRDERAAPDADEMLSALESIMHGHATVTPAVMWASKVA